MAQIKASSIITPKKPGRPPKSFDHKNLKFIIDGTTSTTSAQSETTTLIRTPTKQSPSKKLLATNSKRKLKVLSPTTPNDATPELPSLGMYTSSPIDSPLTNRKRRRNQTLADLASSPLRGKVNYHYQRNVDIPSSPIFSNDETIFSSEENEEIITKKQKVDFTSPFEFLTTTNPCLTPSLTPPAIEINPTSLHKSSISSSASTITASTTSLKPPSKIQLVINKSGRAELFIPSPQSTLHQYASPALSPSPSFNYDTDDFESDFETESEFQKYGVITNKTSTSDAIAAFARTIARSSAKATKRKSKGNKKHHNIHSISTGNTSISPSTLRYINSTNNSITFDNSTSPLSFFVDSQKYQNTSKTGFTVPLRNMSPPSSPIYDPALLTMDPSTPPGSMLMDDFTLGPFGTGMTPYLPTHS